MTRKTVLTAGAVAGAALIVAAAVNAARPRRGGAETIESIPAEYLPQRDAYLDELFSTGLRTSGPNA